MPDIVAIGECCIELFSDGPIAAASSFQRAYSGDALNVLYMASKLGTSCGYMTRVGDDPFSDYMLEEWRKNEIDTAAVKRLPGFAGLVFISLLAKGERELFYYREGSAASTIAPEDLSADYIGGAKVLHVSAITQAISLSSRETALEAVRIARSRNVMVSYDTNLRLRLWTVEDAREAMEEILPYVDVVFPSHPEETTALTGLASEREAIDYFIDRGAKTVAVKSGEDGAWTATSDGVWRVQSIAPRGVADTTGAGDAFDGGFLHAMLQGAGPVEAARWGVACAGLKVSGRGGIVSQPSRDEVEQYVDLVQAERI